MAGFSSWIKQAVGSIVDPEKEQRQALLTKRIQQELSTKKQTFVLSQAVAGLDHTQRDLEQVTKSVYRTIVGRGWKDGKLSEDERKVATWVAQRLELSPSDANAINVEFAKEHFACALAQAMDDGVLDESEVARLNEIATSVGLSAQAFARSFFFQESESFLRGMFLACVGDDNLSTEAWTSLLTATERLGLSKNELLDAIQPQARQFVEHVLADAKSDEKITEQEYSVLMALLRKFRLPTEFHDYVIAETSLLRQLTEIGEGKLPTLPVSAEVATRSGEIIHFRSPSRMRLTRILSSGPKTDEHDGHLTLTDNRLIFSSTTKSDSIGYRKIVAHRGGVGWIEAQIEGKPATQYFFPCESPIPYAVFQSAVAMANQTLVRKPVESKSRSIPRDVRQRTWQKFGGKCAECNAVDYLEFDHIIPVAKGGSNSDANIQLLCRRCNLKKSDHI